MGSGAGCHCHFGGGACGRLQGVATAFIHHSGLAGSFSYELGQLFLALCFKGSLQSQKVQVPSGELPAHRQDLFSSASAELKSPP